MNTNFLEDYQNQEDNDEVVNEIEVPAQKEQKEKKVSANRIRPKKTAAQMESFKTKCLAKRLENARKKKEQQLTEKKIQSKVSAMKKTVQKSNEQAQTVDELMQQYLKMCESGEITDKSLPHKPGEMEEVGEDEYEDEELYDESTPQPKLNVKSIPSKAEPTQVTDDLFLQRGLKFIAEEKAKLERERQKLEEERSFTPMKRVNNIMKAKLPPPEDDIQIFA